MDQNTTVRMVNRENGVVIHLPLERAAEHMQLSVDEMMWALDEFGVCEDFDHIVTVVTVGEAK